MEQIKSTSNYRASDPLNNAAKVAKFLNKPLLLSGEPGTGKTKFAEFYAAEKGARLLEFPTKSTSVAKDLFYQYDAIAHFAEKDKDRNVIEFLEPTALGIAILGIVGKEELDKKFFESETYNEQLRRLRELNATDPEKCREMIRKFVPAPSEAPQKFVVLIDEIDKAPRDFPNDILNEIEQLKFEIRELGITIGLSEESKKQLFIVMTSNFEKNLPDAFLRRCVYFHILFPEDINELKEIIKVHITFDNDAEQQLTARVEEFVKLRSMTGINKKPATSELIDYIKWLKETNGLSTGLHQNETAWSTLMKKAEDIRLFRAGQ